MKNLLLELPDKEKWVCAFLPINNEDFGISTMPIRGLDCKTESCHETMNEFRNRSARIIHDENHFVVPYPEWMKLCQECKRAIWNWYYEELFRTPARNKLPFELFNIEIEKEAAFDLWEYLNYMRHYSQNEKFRKELAYVSELEGYIHNLIKSFEDKRKELRFEGRHSE